MLWDLGLLHVRRLRQRHLLAVLSAAVAVVMLLVSTTLAAGTVAVAAAPERAFLGGDILVLPEVLALPDSPAREGGGWSWTAWSWDEPGPLAAFLPWLFTEGAVVRSPAMDPSLLLHRLKGEEGVRGVYPYYALPAVWSEGGETVRVWLRGRIPDLDRARGWNEYVTAGQPLSAAADFAALVDGYRPRLDGESARAFGYDRYNGRWLVAPDGDPAVLDWPAPEVGARIALAVPRAGPAGFDFTDLAQVTLTVRGLFTVRSGLLDWTSHGLTPDGYTPGVARNLRCSPCMWTREPAVWSTPEIEVSLATLERIAGEVGARLRPQAFLVQVTDLARLRTTAERIAEDLPVTVLPVPDLVGQHLLDALPSVALPHDDLDRIQAGLMARPHPTAPAPTWMRATLLGLGLGMAGLLFFGNLFVLIHGRRHEFAILKVLGARRRDLYVLVVTEALAVAVLGGLLGAGATLPLILYQAGSSGGATGALEALLDSLGLGLGAALLGVPVALLLSLAVTRQRPWSALRDE